MAGCCDPRGCQDMFGEDFARRMAKRYRRRGIAATAGHMLDFLGAGGLAGATVLEIGGGVGEISVELLRRGAASASVAELSPAYDEEARRLADQAGVTDRMSRQIVDVAATPEAVEPADLVVLHRVVCCYPDYARLLGAAADLCRNRLAFSHPPRNLASRAFVAAQNAAFSLRGREFRTFVHPPVAMVGVVAAHGLSPVFVDRGRVWHAAGFVR